MKNFLQVFVLASSLMIFGLLMNTQPAQATANNQPQNSGVICLPGVYMHNPGDCTPLGPSTYLTQMAQQGVTFPITALPAAKPAFDLTYVDTRYGQVRTSNAPVYGSVEDAMTGNKGRAIQRIDSGFAYISYTDESIVNGRRFYMVDQGLWMTANDVSRIGSVPLFQGLTFDRTPDRPFGWVLAYLSPGPVETKRTPGYQVKDYTGHGLNNHEIVQVYTTQKVGSDEWYMVGPDEWVPQNVVARVLPTAAPPAGVTGNRWIEVNLDEQTLAVYDQGQLVFATLIASGLEPFWTRPGLFQISSKLPTTPMRGSFEADHSDAYYLEDVPWTMYFDNARALHGAYWRANLGFPQSHGCVNLSVGDAHWLFDWAKEGDWVYVWDPSGKTPTDPSLYSSGGY
jgi:lipoprotein-anchoring transpeptidase ErfK/SrfK